MPLKTHVATPGWVNSEQLKEKPAEKASLVWMRVQSPSGLALVPFAWSAVDLGGRLR